MRGIVYLAHANSRCVFRLNFVPEAEAEAVRDALAESAIDTYETSPGLLHIGAAGIWVVDGEDYDRARQIVDEVQQRWRDSAKSQPAKNWRDLLARPGELALIMVAIAVVLLISIAPFF